MFSILDSVMVLTYSGVSESSLSLIVIEATSSSVDHGLSAVGLRLSATPDGNYISRCDR